MQAPPSPAAASPAQATPPTPVTAAHGGPPTLADVNAVWPAVLETAGADSSMLGAALRSAQPVEVVDGALVIAFPPSEVFSRRIAAENADHRRLLGEALSAFTGMSMRIAYEIREIEVATAASPLAGDELVARLVQEFDAQEIVPDEPLKEND